MEPSFSGAFKVTLILTYRMEERKKRGCVLVINRCVLIHGLGVVLYSPLVDLLLGRDALLDLPSLIAKVEDNSIAYGLIIFIGMNVRTEYFNGSAFITFQQRGTGKSDERGVG